MSTALYRAVIIPYHEVCCRITITRKTDDVVIYSGIHSGGSRRARRIVDQVLDSYEARQRVSLTKPVSLTKRVPRGTRA